REVLPDTLREQGARVDVVPVYRTVLGEGEASAMERLGEGSVDIVTFTSSSTVRNFLKLAEGTGIDKNPDVLFASIGPITSDAARERGLTVGVEAEESTIPGLVAAICAHTQGC
ncbi:MAG: uroporphyrinogen-III synthase, partial [Actinomycetota bacterium]|nr:uroporphyrinogen-III synthase [Actinomycetota bacterium]